MAEHDRPSGGARAQALLALGAALVGALVYACSFGVHSDALILGNDVVHYALALAEPQGDAPTPANHLAYHWLCRGSYAALCALGGEPGAWLALRAQQLVSAAAGALALYVVARFALRRAGARVGLPLALALGASSGTWIYAAVGDSVVPALAAMAGAWCAALEHARAPSGRPWALLAWLVAALVLRQDALLAVPALLVLLSWRSGAWLLACAGAATLAVYALGWWLAPAGQPFARWLLGVGASGSWNGRLEGGQALVRVLRALLLAVVGSAEYAPLRALPAVLCGALLLALARIPAPQTRRALIACSLGVALRLAFFGWFQAINVEYQIATLVPGVLGFVVWIEPRARDARSALARFGAPCAWLLAACIAFATWRHEIAPTRGDGLAERARIALAAAGDGGLLFSLDTPTSSAVLREQHGRAARTSAGPQLFVAEGGGSTLRPEREARFRARVEAARHSGRAFAVAYDAAIADSWRLAVGAMRAEPQHVEQVLRPFAPTPLARVGDAVVVWLVPAR